MDHLPLPIQSAYEAPKVPYLCRYFYDGSTFDTYPLSKGFDLDCLRSGHVHQYSPENLASFLQSWFFFGVLSEFFGDDFCEDEFLSASPGNPNHFIVTTAILPTLGSKWAASYRSSTKHQRKDLLQKAGECFEVAGVVARWACSDESAELKSPLPSEVSLSVLILGDSLSYIRTRAVDSVSGLDSEVTMAKGSVNPEINDTMARSWGEMAPGVTNQRSALVLMNTALRSTTWQAVFLVSFNTLPKPTMGSGAAETMFKDRVITPEGKFEVTMRVPRTVLEDLGDRRDTSYCRYECRLQIRRLDPRLGKASVESMDRDLEIQHSHAALNDELMSQIKDSIADHPRPEDPGVVEEEFHQKLPVFGAEALNMYQKQCIK